MKGIVNAEKHNIDFAGTNNIDNAEMGNVQDTETRDFEDAEINGVHIAENNGNNQAWDDYVNNVETDDMYGADDAYIDSPRINSVGHNENSHTRETTQSTTRNTGTFYFDSDDDDTNDGNDASSTFSTAETLTVTRMSPSQIRTIVVPPPVTTTTDTSIVNAVPLRPTARHSNIQTLQGILADSSRRSPSTSTSSSLTIVTRQPNAWSGDQFGLPNTPPEYYNDSFSSSVTLNHLDPDLAIESHQRGFPPSFFANFEQPTPRLTSRTAPALGYTFDRTKRTEDLTTHVTTESAQRPSSLLHVERPASAQSIIVTRQRFQPLLRTTDRATQTCEHMDNTSVTMTTNIATETIEQLPTPSIIERPASAQSVFIDRRPSVPLTRTMEQATQTGEDTDNNDNSIIAPSSVRINFTGPLTDIPATVPLEEGFQELYRLYEETDSNPVALPRNIPITSIPLSLIANSLHTTITTLTAQINELRSVLQTSAVRVQVAEINNEHLASDLANIEHEYAVVLGRANFASLSEGDARQRLGWAVEEIERINGEREEALAAVVEREEEVQVLRGRVRKLEEEQNERLRGRGDGVIGGEGGKREGECGGRWRRLSRSFF